ncbi:MAG: hypothetical protein V2J10_03990 [Wenzhouxiangella sp.]|jgi:uncharacterized protein YceK|nr:hypothetical protein [Wenzhouxiangella sp.]
MPRKVLLSFAIVMLCLVGCASTPMLESPREANVPSGMTTAQVEQAILDAMRARGWSVHDRSRGHIIADLNVRAHFARVDIRYSADSVRLEYVDSDNLDYEIVDGQQRIHGNFNSWMTNLIRDIERNLSFVG